MQTVISEIAARLGAIANCQKAGNAEWEEKHTDEIERLVSEHLPSGSGFDSGTQFDFERSTRDRLVFTTSFHHMHESGYYNGWSNHDVIATPTFSGFALRVTGRDRDGIKEYIAETFQEALGTILYCHEDCLLRRMVKRFLDKHEGYNALKSTLDAQSWEGVQ